MSTLTLRKLVCLCFVVVYVAFGLPLWYKLTTIYRAPLPTEYINHLHNNNQDDIHLVIPVYIKSDTYRFPDIHDAVQVQINHMLASKPMKVQWSLQILPYEESKVTDSDYVVSLLLDEFVGFTIPYASKETVVFYNDEVVTSNDLPFYVAQTLIEHTFEPEWSEFGKEKTDKEEHHGKDMAIAYSPNVHLSISLLTGDGHPVAWEIESTLQSYFTPLRKFLSPLVNFTIDTGIVYFNDLNLHSLGNLDTPTWQDLSHTLDLSELSSNNYYTEQSVLNLAIVFPGENTPDLKFINSTSDLGRDSWQSFMVPQWGVLIINKSPLPENAQLTTEYLKPIMYKFSREIFQLLGLTSTSTTLSTPYMTTDSFKRLTIIQNLEKSIKSLWSLLKLTDSFPQMAIPREVLDNVNEALDIRLKVVELLNDPEKGGDEVWNRALLLSNQLFAICEDAFFHKEMVQQNFFPQEHKIAVYLPLLGPISVVTFIGLIKSLKEKDQTDENRSNEEKGENGRKET